MQVQLFCKDDLLAILHRLNQPIEDPETCHRLPMLLLSRKLCAGLEQVRQAFKPALGFFGDVPIVLCFATAPTISGRAVPNRWSQVVYRD